MNGRGSVRDSDDNATIGRYWKMMQPISRTMTAKSHFCTHRPTPVETHPCRSCRRLRSFDLPACKPMGNFLQGVVLCVN